MSAALDRRRLPLREDPAAPGPGRYFDPDFKLYAVKVLPGEHRVTSRADEMLVTVLGSCVSACVRDPVVGVGGMNHFMLPGEPRDPGAPTNESMRYGHFAMEQLINHLLRAGGRRERLEVKLFGGAHVTNTSIPIGQNNIRFVREFLIADGLTVDAEDLGGVYPRRIHYLPRTGKVFRLELRRSNDGEVFERETGYRERLRHQALEGSVELFD